MFTVASLWIPFTIIAALGQVARNAMQRSLTGPLGTWGATNIRFLFGFPFSIIFFAVVVAVTGDAVPWPTAAFWPWLLLGALSQIVATGLMLLAMNDRSFVVTTAYLKTEAIQTAIFGFIFLGDHLTVLKVVAILIATVGVVITALRPGGEKGFAELKPTIIGLVAAGCFALSAIGFRGAIITVPGVSFVTAASYTLVFGLFVQTLVLTIYLLLRAPDVLVKIFGLWKPSMLAGFMGAFASQFWFLAFALTAAANVRTLALVEVLFAQAVAYYSFKQPLSARELSGIVLIVIGVALLVAVLTIYVIPRAVRRSHCGARCSPASWRVRLEFWFWRCVTVRSLYAPYPGMTAVRAGRGVLFVQAAIIGAGTVRHRADRVGRGAAVAASQFRSSGSTGSGETSTPSSISARASSGEASP